MSTTVVEGDLEYADLMKAEKRIARLKKRNHYKVIELPDCCTVCIHHRILDPYEQTSLDCFLLINESWAIAGVAHFGWCDKFEK